MPETLLVGLAHPDDEIGCAGTLLAQRARGDRVVVVWLTRGEMTDALGDRDPAEVAALREASGHEAGRLLDVETRFLDFPDTRLEATPDAAARVASLVAEIRPTGLLTWGDAWTRGRRHPDHQACGKIFRDALTLARIGRVVAPRPPHRAPVPVFTFRDVHSPLPAVAVEIAPYRDRILALAEHYRRLVGFGDPAWLQRLWAARGAPFGLAAAEVFDAWETEGGPVTTLLPARPFVAEPHPEVRPVSTR